jgi:hypothetical protein
LRAHGGLCFQPTSTEEALALPLSTARAARSPALLKKESVMKSGRLFVSIFVLAVASAPLAQAQFGSGIVYDPTQSAHAIQQIQQNESQLQK